MTDNQNSQSQEPERFLDALFRVPRKKGKMKIIDAPTPALEGPIADTHAHLAMVDAPLVLARSAYYDVDFVCCMTEADGDMVRVYDSLDRWTEEAAQLIQTIAPGKSVPRVTLACGVHPHNAKDYTDEVEALLRKYLADPRTVALGEIGLDYHYDLSPRDVQREVFARQIRLANETGLRLILHVREAHDEALEILDREGADPKNTLLHCCSLSPEEIAPWVQRGYRIAYGGAITFANSQDARVALHDVPLDTMMTETDSPYMAPTPLRGAECGPEFTIFTAACMAEELGFAPGEQRQKFLAQLYANAMDFFDREPTPWQLQQR